MDAALIIVLLTLLAFVLALGALTGIGERRRGGRLAVAVVAGLFFPLAWIAWYTRDELQGS